MAKQTEEQTYKGLLNSLLRIRSIRNQVGEIDLEGSTEAFKNSKLASASLADQLERELQKCYEAASHPDRSAREQMGLGFEAPKVDPGASAANAKAFLEDGGEGHEDAERFGEDPDSPKTDGEGDGSGDDEQPDA